MKKFLFFRNVLIFLALISSTANVLSQDNPAYLKMPRVLYPSGDAGALGRYGDYPVDISTGVPSISIPIFEIQVNNYKLPINISYHASGNRVDDISSAVGLGWSLNSGGCITRTVKGKPDEADWISNKNVYRREYETYDQLNHYSTDDSITCRLNTLLHGNDLEADLYSFNFNGYSGQFTHDSDNNLILATYEDLKISGGPISGFTILAPDGAKYIFNDGDSMSVSNQSYKNSWYINTIITPNLDTIKFKYKSTGFIQGEHHPSFNCECLSWNVHSPTYQYIDFTDIVNLRYLSSITFKNGKVNFIYGLQRKDLRPHQLDSINVVDPNGKRVRLVLLGHSYFVSDTSDPAYGSSDPYYNRLKLDNIRILNPNNFNDKQTYSFDYNQTKLPPYFEDFGTINNYYSQDFWGYYNNAQTNEHLMPIANLCSVTAANRNVDEEAMQATILNKITFPAGGRTEFEYEANTNRGGSMKLGGLRIKTIKNFIDAQSLTPSLVKSYEYPTGGFPTSWISRSNILDNARWVYVNSNNSTYTTNYIASPIGNLSYNNGLIAVYDKVWEYTGENKEIKTEYNYNVLQESSYDSHFYRPHLGGTHFYPVYYKDQAYRSGQMTSQIDYKKDGNDYIKVREISNTWTPYRVQEAIIGLKIIPIDPTLYGCTQQGFPADVYQYFDVLMESGVNKLTKKIEKLYTGNDIIEKTTDLEYSSIENTEGHGFVTKEILTNSIGEKKWKESRYLPDVFTNPTGVYGVMKDKFMIGNPLEVINGKEVNETEYFLSSNVFSYDLFANQPQLYQIKQMQLESPSMTYTEWTDTRLKTETTADSYDKNGNLLNISPTDNISTGYKWGYNNSFPVAKVINAQNKLLYTDGDFTNQINFPGGSPGEGSTSFTTSVTGNIVLTISQASNPGSNHISNYNYTLTGAGYEYGVLCIASSGTGCSNFVSTVTFNDMPVGEYYLTLTRNIDEALSGCHITYGYKAQVVSSSSITEFFYEGFEESSEAGVTASTLNLPSYAGKYYNSGSYQVQFTIPNSRNYVVEYHYWDGAKWVKMKKTYTNNMILNDGSAIDEVRVYPSDAQMTTYTYDPLIGMTSSTDENNISTYYEYDSFGRLKCIKDKDKNILKMYDYHYQDQ